MNLFTLDKKGVFAALLLGICVLFFGGSFGPYFLFVLLLFLVVSDVVTELGRNAKKLIGMYEKARGWRNVLANGFVAFLIALLLFANSYFHLSPKVLVVVYTASMSAVMADKFASEIGVLDGMPVMLLGFKKVAKGTSGAITLLGTFASFFGSLLIAFSILLLYPSLLYVVVISAAGFFGSIVDSVFGYFEEKGIGNKYTSNLACAIFGAILAVALLAL